MSSFDVIHARYVHDRRVRVLSETLAPLIPPDASILDVGAGDGLLARRILDLRPDVRLSALDVIARRCTHVPVELFDGRTLPFDDGVFDNTLLVDVLHYIDNPTIVLCEAMRVSRHGILIKDHTSNGLFAQQTLRFMDRVGNGRYGIPIPGNYWSRERWLTTFTELGLCVRFWKSDLHLYPNPADWMFGRRLHFVAQLQKG